MNDKHKNVIEIGCNGENFIAITFVDESKAYIEIFDKYYISNYYLGVEGTNLKGFKNKEKAQTFTVDLKNKW